jgi:hypothetical protein
MRDFSLLAWLRWRQWRSSALYWLRTLGYDPQRQNFIDRLYALYLILFGIVWIIVVGIAAVSQAAGLGRSVPPEVAAALVAAMPWLVIAATIWFLLRALRSSPVLLSFPDIAYVAASPVSRAAFVLVNFFQACLQHLVIALPLFALIVVVLAQPFGEAVAHTAALRALVVVAPLVPLLLALAWMAGLARLERREARASGFWWLAGFLLAPLAWLLPPLRWPGELIAVSIQGAVPYFAVALLFAFAALAVLMLARVASRVNLIAAAEESRTYARLNALGLMAFLAPDVALRIRRQEALAKRRASFRLPNAAGVGSLAARSLLLSLRRPMALLRLLLWGAGTAFTAAWLALGHPPLVLWFFWVTFLSLAPPKMLVESFEADMADPYLRQLLPMSNGLLAVVGGIVPLIVTTFGVWAGWAVSARQFGLSPEGWALGMGAGLCLVLDVLLAQAAAAGRVGFFGWRPPYAAWLLLSIALVAVSLLLFKSLAAGFAGAIIALLLLSLVMFGSEPVPLD